MKKFFTLIAAVACASAAFAQTESAFIDTENSFIASEAEAIAANTKLCESASVVMSQAWDDTYKKVAMTGEADLVNTVTIDGATYTMPAGIQAQTNPNPNNLTSFGQVQGAVFKFDVKADGVLYVFGKMTYNKNYYVWGEGEIGVNANPIAYTFAAATVSAENGDATVGYTLPGDAMGYYVLGNGYDDGAKYLNAAQCVEYAAGGDIATLTHWTKGNALGVIAFPAYTGCTYYVNACGSKITTNGFVFIPGATAVAPITFSKGESDGINNVTANTAAQSVRKVVTANGIQIVKGAQKFTVAGQAL